MGDRVFDLPYHYTEVYLLLMRHLWNVDRVVEELNEKYGSEAVSVVLLRKLIKKPRFKEGWKQWLLQLGEVGHEFKLFRDSKSIELWYRMVQVGEKYLTTAEKDPEFLKIGMDAANSVLDRSPVTQKRSKQEIDETRTIHMTDDQARLLTEAIQESHRARQAKTIDITPNAP